MQAVKTQEIHPSLKIECDVTYQATCTPVLPRVLMAIETYTKIRGDDLYYFSFWAFEL